MTKPPRKWLDPVGPNEGEPSDKSPASKLVWFAGLALGSGLVVILTAYALRAMLFLE